MSSNTNYQPYCYLIGWSALNTWYYGVKFAKNCNPTGLWVTYFTSSKHVENFRKQHGEPDIIQIRKTFNNKHDALLWEHKVLRRLNVHKQPAFLNKSSGLGRYYSDHTGQKQSPDHISKRVKSKKGYSHSISTRQKLSTSAAGKTIAKNAAGETIKISVNDPRLASGELKGNTYGYFVAKDLYGNHYHISKDDPRYTSGELVAESKGRVPWNKIDTSLTSEEVEIQKIKQEFNIINSKSGLLWINKDGRKTRVHPILFERYYSVNGWITGR